MKSCAIKAFVKKKCKIVWTKSAVSALGTKKDIDKKTNELSQQALEYIDSIENTLKEGEKITVTTQITY
ncbi:hypothetical protein [Endomicrobium proavitum]|uniref:Uncharacterized protein n=1 Tax=Endomicrobium proavitum TaxID=1408281 RepID=A0A0G3WJK7_9BACT|nr:hypothetical protein [Endomicrobium proavitum]AKL98468.1 hypothetical protein Epro_1089 [Endomicrobium proavitum]